MKLKRLMAALLCVVMLLPMFSAAGHAEQSPMTSETVFAEIEKKLQTKSLVRSTLTDEETTQLAKQTVESMGYETEERGDGCFTFDVDGEPCIFNGHTYRILSNATPVEGYVDDGQVVTVDYSKRSNGPDAKDVYLIEPFYGTDSSFTKQYQTECSSIAKATGGTYTLYKTSNATVDAVADALEAGGVVVFDSHGDTDYSGRGEDYTSKANTSYLLLATGTGLTSSDKSKATGEFASYNHAYSSGGYYYVDGTAITNHMEKSAPNSLVWMAICLGMATDGMEQPLRDHGVGVVYGYSQSVTFDGDYDYEETFWTQMKKGATVADAVSAMKSKHGGWDPGMNCSTISAAKKNYAAFPIVASEMDAYPGHGNVDALQTVTSDWTLFGTAESFTVNAASADTNCGTVAISGKTITATPKEGYAASGYTVSPAGACKVTQNGNTFSVSNITADCTVTISFKALEKVTVSFVVPDGVSCSAIETYEGTEISLPKPTGTPTANKYTYSFGAWTTASYKDSTTKPSTYKAYGSKVTPTEDTIYYAVYTYKVSNKTYYTTELASTCTHVWDDGKVTTAATCAKAGVMTYTCTVCGTTKTEAISKLAHDYGKTVTAPTCTEAGYTTYTCSRCGDSYKTDTVEALGHNYISGVCARCGEEDPNYVPPETDPCEGYIDIDRASWYHTAADFVIENGLMGSTSAKEKTFEASTACTRGMIVTILYSLAGKPEVQYAEKFSDVKQSDWFSSAVMWAYQNGVVSGYNNGKFGANDKITREQMAVILKAYAEKIEGADTTRRANIGDFIDEAKVTWSREAIRWAVAEGLISGKGVGNQILLDPQGQATRAEVAVILMKFLCK